MDRTVVLVEGASDQAAVLALAALQGRDLSGERVLVAATGGVTSFPGHLERLGPHGLGVRLAGLYDVREERFVRRGLERAGLAGPGADLERHGFFACAEDLEDELIRALGVDRVLAVVEERGDLPAYRILERQPAHRDSTPAQRVHRFLGSQGGRMTAYATHLVEALDPDRPPPPLGRLLTWVRGR